MKNRTAIPALSLAAALTLALGACGQTTGAATDSPTSGSNRPTATVTETESATAETVTETAEPVEAEPEPAPSLTGTDPGILTLGESFTYSDGLQVTISKPEAFTSSEWSFPESSPGLRFTVTIVNGTGTKYDPSLELVNAQIGNTEAEQIFDTENGLDGSPSTSVLPGREVTYKVGFAGTDAENLVVEYQPGDWERGPLTFTPNGK